MSVSLCIATVFVVVILIPEPSLSTVAAPINALLLLPGSANSTLTLSILTSAALPKKLISLELKLLVKLLLMFQQEIFSNKPDILQIKKILTGWIKMKKKNFLKKF